MFFGKAVSLQVSKKVIGDIMVNSQSIKYDKCVIRTEYAEYISEMLTYESLTNSYGPLYTYV
jgi:RNA-binding protein YlmH